MDRRIHQQVERQRRRPHIYSLEQIERLLAAARARQVPRSPLIASTTFTMIALAYGAGLRVSELVALTLDDVDLETGVVTIRDTKFFKTRRVPLHATVVDALRKYREQRAATGADLRPTARFFWHEARFAGYSRAAARELLVVALRQAGLKPNRGKCGPRIHDLRHTFVVHRLLDWYRRGIDPEPLLPSLSAYLGHASLHSTLLYVTVTRELLGLAAERFRTVGAVHLRIQEVSP
ncbi:MAG: tyrosine-type recombinase/integrase [Gammaproteobacteria bacterium]